MNAGQLLPQCPECGGNVVLLARSHRTRELLIGIHVDVPANFEIPTCCSCGSESMTLEISEPLDKLLLEHVRQQLSKFDEDQMQVLLGDFPSEIDVDQMFDERYEITYLGKASRISGNRYKCLAKVPGVGGHPGEALCVVEVTMRKLPKEEHEQSNSSQSR